MCGGTCVYRCAARLLSSPPSVLCPLRPALQFFMAVPVSRAASAPNVGAFDAGKARPASVSLSDPALGLALNLRGVDACAIQVMRGAATALDRAYFILAYPQLLPRTRLLALLSSQLLAPNSPADNLLTFTRELLRNWRHHAVPGNQLRGLLRAASARLPLAELNSLKLLCLSCSLTPPPTPRASPGLGRLPAFGHTFHASTFRSHDASSDGTTRARAI